MSGLGFDITDDVRQAGTMVLLRRPSPHGMHFDLPVMAMVRAYQPAELVGGIEQGDRRVVISNAEIAARQWPGPPRRGDEMIISDRTVTLRVDATTVRIGDFIVKHVMQVRGA